MADVPKAAADHYRNMVILQAAAAATGRRAWRNVTPRYLSESWAETVRSLSRQVQQLQVRAAGEGASYGASTLAQQGDYVPPDVFVDPRAWGGGYAPDGRDLDGLLYSPITTTKEAIAAGATVPTALAAGSTRLELILGTVIADAGRQAAGVDTAARTGVGWIRMVSPGACTRCVILAGRWYRWNDGFLRHPNCACVHVMSRVGSLEMAKERGFIDDPYEYFNSLSEKEQDRLFGSYDAQAIRDGGDIFQVVNSRRGRNGLTTSEGTTRRGYAGRLGIGGGQRLTPEGIYRQARTRDEALKLLEQQGYILPGGQNPEGVLRSSWESWGALGRGGTRVGARAQIQIDRAAGTQSRYSMTEAQRRLLDSRLRWDAVRQGRNPYSRDGRGLTPAIAAQVETDYRRWLATGGQIFTR